MSPSKPSAADVLNLLQSIDFNTYQDDERRQVLAATRKLTAELEKPWETIVHSVWAVPAANASLKIGVDINLFQEMSKASKAVSPEEMASATGTNAALTTRIMRHMASMHYLTQQDGDSYLLGKFTEALIDPVLAAGLDFFFSQGWGRTCIDLPKYLATVNYKPPEDAHNGSFQYAFEIPGKAYWEWLSENPNIEAQFGRFMSGYASDREAWVDIYPTEQILANTKSDNEVVFVDVGGNVGHDAGKLVKKHPQMAGKVVVQDREPVVVATKYGDGIKGMAHDFFASQPIKGASVYYLHSILHDWSDEASIEILKQLRSALTPGKSKILINENVIPSIDPGEHRTALDIIMMGLNASKERSEGEWRSLIEASGLEIARIYAGKVESVIEVVLS